MKRMKLNVGPKFSVGVKDVISEGDEDPSWAENSRNITAKGEKSSFHLSGLSPFTKYFVRLIAANELGISPPSDVVEFVTQEEGIFKGRDESKTKGRRETRDEQRCRSNEK